jgi:TetR/AcrR family transcriptional regulator
VVTVGGLAALVAAAREAARPFVPEPISPEAWRQHVFDLLVNGLGPAARGDGDATRAGL